MIFNTKVSSNNVPSGSCHLRASITIGDIGCDDKTQPAAVVESQGFRVEAPKVNSSEWPQLFALRPACISQRDPQEYCCAMIRAETLDPFTNQPKQDEYIGTVKLVEPPHEPHQIR